MASLVFDQVPLLVINDQLNFTLANFYAHLVTAEPASSLVNVTGLVLVTGGNYAPLDLVGKQVIASGVGGAKLNFADPSWISLYAGAATPIVGVVICQKIGAVFSGTDPVISYLALQSPYEPQVATPGATFTFQFSADGALAATRT